jgi:hypothetical protein
MKIARRQFLKIMGGFGASLVAEDLAPKGIVKPGEIVLPKEPTVIRAMPSMLKEGQAAAESKCKNRCIRVDMLSMRHWTYLGGGCYNIELSVAGNVTTFKALEGWRGPGRVVIPSSADENSMNEWFCVLCGLSNSMLHAHCSQCGAARDWVVT